jgi:hypothetical protein
MIRNKESTKRSWQQTIEFLLQRNRDYADELQAAPAVL